MEAETGVTPPALLKRPKLSNESMYLYSLWKELAGSRQYSTVDAQCIPFSEVYMYGRAHGYKGGELATLWEDVHRVDSAWLDVCSKMQKEQAAQSE